MVCRKEVLSSGVSALRRQEREKGTEAAAAEAEEEKEEEEEEAEEAAADCMLERVLLLLCVWMCSCVAVLALVWLAWECGGGRRRRGEERRGEGGQGRLRAKREERGAEADQQTDQLEQIQEQAQTSSHIHPAAEEEGVKVQGEASGRYGAAAAQAID
jgi:hypothetical protein